MAQQLQVGTKWQQGMTWRIVSVIGGADVIFELGKAVLLTQRVSDDVRESLEGKNLIEFVFDCGKKVVA